MPTLLLVWFFWRVRNEDRLVSLCQSQACYPVRSTSSRAPRLQGRGWDASKEGVHEKGECAQESTTVPTMDKIWHRVRTWCCPQSRKEGKKVSLWEMRLCIGVNESTGIYHWQPEVIPQLWRKAVHMLSAWKPTRMWYACYVHTQLVNFCSQ